MAACGTNAAATSRQILVTADDGRIIVDVVAASLLASFVKLIGQKAFLEPAAAWIGRAGLKKAMSAIKDAWLRLEAKA